MTFSDLTNAVVSNTRRSDKISLIQQSINLALKEICQIEPFNFLRAEIDFLLASGTNSISFDSTQVSQIVEVRLLPYPPIPIGSDGSDLSNVTETDPTALQSINIGYEVTILDQRTLQKRFPNLQANSRGIPEYCFITPGLITFIPPTSLDRTVRVLTDSYVPQLVQDDDVNPIPSTDNAVICWATERVFASIEMFENTQYWAQKYAQALRFARDQNDRRTGQLRQMRGAMTVRPRYIDPRINHYTRQTYGDVMS